jgi:hypothetical protein
LVLGATFNPRVAALSNPEHRLKGFSMLYNPKWDKPLLDQWIGWLGKKPKKKRYAYHLSDICAVGQFYGGGGWIGQPDPEFRFLNTIAAGKNASDWTFGKCLSRARKAHACRQEV